MLLKLKAPTRERERESKTAQNGNVLVVILLIIGVIIGGIFVAYKIFHQNLSTPSSKTEIRTTPTPTPSPESQPITPDEKVKNNFEETPVSSGQTIKCLGADRKFFYTTQEACDAHTKYWTKILGSFPTDPEEIIQCLGADGKYSTVPRKTCEDVNKFWAAHPPSGTSSNNSSSSTSSSSSSSSDTTAPLTTDNTDSSWHTSNVTITLTCTDNSSGCDKTYYTTDTSTPTTSSTQGTSILLTTSGTYSIKYFSVDKSGNQETVKTATNSVKVDKTAPVDPGTPTTTTPTNSTSQTWTWTAATDAVSGIANYAWRVVTSLGAAVANGTTTLTTTATNLAEGIYNFFVKANDNAGNQSGEVQGTATVDITAPVTTDSGIDTSWHTSAVAVTLTCADTNGSGCAHTYYTTDGTTPTTSSSTGTSFSVSTDGTHTIKYFSVDSANNQESVKTATNTVKIDTTAPSVPGTPSTSSAINNNQPTWTWTVSTDSGSGLANPTYTIQWSEDSSFASGVSSTTVNTNTFTHSSVLADGTWYFRAKAADSVGNNSSYSANGSMVINTNFLLRDLFSTTLSSINNTAAEPGPGTRVSTDGISDQIINGNFETSGFASWTQTAGDGTLTDETVDVHGGGHAAKITAGSTVFTAQLIQYSVPVVSNTNYTYSFWTHGDGTHAGRYAIYDATNAAWILPLTSTNITGSTYQQVNYAFTTTANTTLIQIYIRCPSADGGYAFFDDVSVTTSNQSVTISSGQLHIQGVASINGTPRVYNNTQLSRTAGKIALASFRVTTAKKMGNLGLIQADGTAIHTIKRTTAESGGTIEAGDGSSLATQNIYDGQLYNVLFSMRTNGSYVLTNDGSGFQLTGVSDVGNANPIYLGYSAPSGYDQDFYTDTWESVTGPWQPTALASDSFNRTGLGTEKVTNSDFETAGFANWTQVNSNGGSITDETTLIHAGGHAAKLTGGPNGGFYSQLVHYSVPVTAGTVYNFSFWTRGDGTNQGQYALFDTSNNGYIQTMTATGVAGTTYQVVNYQFTAPTNCSIVQLYVRSPLVNGGSAYFDDVSIRQAAPLNTTDGNGLPETGGASKTWTNKLGIWNISSNTAFGYLTGGMAIATVDVGIHTPWVETKISNYTGGNAGVVARYIDSSNYLAAYYDGTNIKLDRVISGSTTNLISGAVTYAAGAKLILRLDETRVTVYYNGAVIGTANTQLGDYQLTSANLVGLYSTNASNTYDDFVAYSVFQTPSSSLALDTLNYKKVACMGDSTTQGTVNYQNKLRKLLGDGWATIDYGQSGQTTDGMLARFQTNVIDHNANYVIIYGGVNDVSQNKTANQIETNLQAMYTAAHNAGIKVVAVTITPWKGAASWTSGKQTVQDAVNSWILNTATNIDYKIDAYTQLEDVANPDQLLPTYDGGDHLHLSTTGYITLAQYIYNNVVWQ